jgi:hypothetical protein
MSLTKLSLGRNYDVIYKLFLPRESLLDDIPAGDGNIEKLFYVVYSPFKSKLFRKAGREEETTRLSANTEQQLERAPHFDVGSV